MWTLSRSFDDGIVICGDGTDPDLIAEVVAVTGRVPLISTDPPYGRVLDEEWDQTDLTDEEFANWMLRWTRAWEERALQDAAAFYVWGGVGVVGFRPFFKYISLVEGETGLRLANLITWSKKRAYGVQHNYLFTREELAYFCKGDPKKPRCFNVPLLDELRGYAGYNKKYPARSEFKRRTNVWTDVTEVMRGKLHPAQKAQRVIEIPIEVHTQPGEWVIDPFAGSGTMGLAARRLGRRFVLIEKDESHFETIVRRLDDGRKDEETHAITGSAD